MEIHVHIKNKWKKSERRLNECGETAGGQLYKKEESCEIGLGLTLNKIVTSEAENGKRGHSFAVKSVNAIKVEHFPLNSERSCGGCPPNMRPTLLGFLHKQAVIAEKLRGRSALTRKRQEDGKNARKWGCLNGMLGRANEDELETRNSCHVMCIPPFRSILIS